MPDIIISMLCFLFVFLLLWGFTKLIPYLPYDKTAEKEIEQIQKKC